MWGQNRKNTFPWIIDNSLERTEFLNVRQEELMGREKNTITFRKACGGEDQDAYMRWKIHEDH